MDVKHFDTFIEHLQNLKEQMGNCDSSAQLAVFQRSLDMYVTDFIKVHTMGFSDMYFDNLKGTPEDLETILEHEEGDENGQDPK